jgi:hypothetical protein
MVNNSADINKMNNHPHPIPLNTTKDHDIWRWKSRSFLGTRGNEQNKIQGAGQVQIQTYKCIYMTPYHVCQQKLLIHHP